MRCFFVLSNIRGDDRSTNLPAKHSSNKEGPIYSIQARVKTQVLKGNPAYKLNVTLTEQSDIKKCALAVRNTQQSQRVANIIPRRTLSKERRDEWVRPT